MRMWNIDPKLLCRRHLLGEHFEMHSFLGSIKKGRKVDGYIQNGSLDISNIKNRHDQLSKEMVKRGYKHKTEMEEINFISKGNNINIYNNIIILFNKCLECKKLISFYKIF